MQDDDAAAIVVGPEAGAPGARDEDIAEVPPPEREEAAKLGRRQLQPLDPVERGPERREMQRNAVAVLPHEVLPFLQRAVVEAQEDVEHELGELVAAVLGGAALAVCRAHESRRGGGRDELRLDEAGSEAKTFLDLSPRGMEAKDGFFEEGLNGLAFHPKFKDNGLFYLCYTMQKPKRIIITEMKANGDVADEKTERVILEIPMINWNHHGGNILFGPDGYLYVVFGDGGGANDMFKNSRKMNTFHSKIIRIDVDFDGTIGWNGEVVPDRATLENKLVQVAALPDQPEVHLRPNKLVSYKVVAMVMASAQRLGVTKIGLVGNEQFLK